MEIYGMTGERLGFIGAPAEQDAEQLPEWKNAFKPSPSISIRKGIASNFDPPYEDTATIVLTAPSGKFVDIRLPLGYDVDGNDSTSVLQHPSFWAFSGTVKTTFLEPPAENVRADAVAMAYSAHAVFTHDLDSKGPGIVDEGDMFLLPNGDTMEVGVWTNPSTGKYEMYKEYWTEPEPMSGMGVIDPVTNRPGSQLNRSPVTLAETTDSSDGRGIFLRIGDFAQGIYQPSTSNLPILFVRYERRDHMGLISGAHHQCNDTSAWQMDPRSTGDECSFPMSLVLDHHGTANKFIGIHDIGRKEFVEAVGISS